MTMPVRTRFAPSPTGYLHIGGLRTALYCYLLAKKTGGKFLLRIEDTDQERLVEDAVDNLLEVLEWAGINHEEDLVVQSQRLPQYKKAALQLIETGHAYYCFCTKSDLDQMRERQVAFNLPPRYDGRCRELSSKDIAEKLESGAAYVIRQKIPAAKIVEFKDLIRGKVKFETKDIDDHVLMKSDGFPTYHLANVVDDHDMQISHVLRGEEWLPSTPRHLLLYEAFGYEPPNYAHLPLILNKDKSKLSKRHNDVSTQSYRDKGYLKEALLNFIALLGWNPGDNREIFSMDELIEAFSVERINKSGAVFDVEKLNWFNWQWRRRFFFEDMSAMAKKLDPDVTISSPKPNHWEYAFKSNVIEDEFNRYRAAKLLELATPYLPANVLKLEASLLERAMLTIEDKILKEPELSFEYASFYFVDDIELSPLILNEKLGVDREVAKKIIDETLSGLEFSGLNSLEEIKAQFMPILQESGLKTGQALWPLRFALSGAEFSPGVFELMWVIGLDETRKRLNNALDYLRTL